VDLNQLLHRHQIALMQLARAESPEERRAHSQFASDYAEKIHFARDQLGAPAQLRASSEDQFGHAACVTARVVLMPPVGLPYAVVICRDGEESLRHSFRTMREAETHIRQFMPTPAPRSTLYDRESEQI
jgi:hypothetical protein